MSLAALLGGDPQQQPQRGFGGMVERFFNPQNALGQFGQALMAGSGTRLGDAMGYMMQANQAKARQQANAKPTRHVQQLGSQVGIIDETTGEFTPTYSAPKAPGEFEQLLDAAGIKPGTPEYDSAMKARVTNMTDPVTSIPLPGGAVYMGPRSGIADALGGPQGGMAEGGHTGGTDVGSLSTPPLGNSPPVGGVSGSLAPRGIRNNNPLNLTDSPWTRKQAGFSGTDNGGRYARFDSPESGLGAAQHLLGSYLSRGFDTPQEIIGRWAPRQENGASTGNYTNYVAHQLGIAPNAPVTADQLPTLARAMAEFENGQRAGSSGAKASSGREAMRSQATQAIARGADRGAVAARFKQMTGEDL